MRDHRPQPSGKPTFPAPDRSPRRWLLFVHQLPSRSSYRAFKQSARRLDQYVWTGAWNPTPLFTVELSGERDRGRLAAGRFTQTLVGTRLRVNLSPDLSIAGYVQPPKGFEFAHTAKVGNPGKWVVQAQGNNKYLA